MNPRKSQSRPTGKPERKFCGEHHLSDQVINSPSAMSVRYLPADDLSMSCRVGTSIAKISWALSIHANHAAAGTLPNRPQKNKLNHRQTYLALVAAPCRVTDPIVVVVHFAVVSKYIIHTDLC